MSTAQLSSQGSTVKCQLFNSLSPKCELTKPHCQLPKCQLLKCQMPGCKCQFSKANSQMSNSQLPCANCPIVFNSFSNPTFSLAFHERFKILLTKNPPRASTTPPITAPEPSSIDFADLLGLCLRFGLRLRLRLRFEAPLEVWGSAYGLKFELRLRFGLRL